jgi:predicted Fe-Mo cluster-binding NifX family protein
MAIAVVSYLYPYFSQLISLKGNSAMKIAVSSQGKDLDSLIDPRFGRCAYFLFVETDTMSFEVFDNQSITSGGGAGIQSAQFISSKGANAVITGNCGPNAVKTLVAAGIEVFLGNTGIVSEVLQKYTNGTLRPTNTPNASEYSGMVGVTSFGRGMGMGGQRGLGRGRGMGRQRRLGVGRNKT